MNGIKDGSAKDDRSIRFAGFQEKRMKIFGELVKMYWNGQLNDTNDLNRLTAHIRDKFGFDEQDIPFIKDHIRIAMGLDPRQGQPYSDELDLVKKSRVISEPIIAKIEGVCEFCDNENCNGICKHEAFIYRRNEGSVIDNNKCLSCGQCVTNCDFGALADKIEFIPLIDMLKDENTTVFAAVAPAIAGQFGENVTLGQLRTAFKLMGFADMIEVAMFADILTIREAFEFNKLVKTEEDFFLTSCCCPVWFNLTKKGFPEMFKHMSPSVSPMIAAGRFLKELYKGAKVVFFAPCIAKKQEINEPEIRGAIDFVINFRELAEIFNALDIHPEQLQGEEKDQASLGGRIYARTGGVSFSVKTVVNRLEPRRVIKLKAKKVDGVRNCKELLEALSSGKDVNANFIEGMGCEGGCVGGPRTNVDKEISVKVVNEFGEDSLIMTPFDNLNVMKILRQLGANAIEDVADNENISALLTRG
ncbi:MAG TPA: [Fe-Fe] hydrogenase large subunit C-terminal domain-containing protein [Clostridia bacterium]